MGGGGHAPFGGAVFVDRRARLDHVRGEGRIPEDLLGHMPLGQHRQIGVEIHPQRARGGVLAQPLHVFAQGVLGGRAVGRTAAFHAGAHRLAAVDPNAPFVHRDAVGNALVTGAGHGEPGVRKPPAQVRRFFAVVVVAVDGLAVNFTDMLAEEFGNVLVGGPVDRYTQLVAVDLLEFLLEVRPVEPVVAEPVEVGELLVRQLVELAVRPGREGLAHEVVHIQGRQGDVLALALHEVRKRHHVAVAHVGADEIGVVDVGIVEVLARGPLGLELFDHVAFLDQVEGDFDAGDLLEGFGQDLGFIFMRGDGLGHDLDIHPLEGLGGLDEPFHLLHLLGFAQGRGLELFVDPFLGRFHLGAMTRGPCQTAGQDKHQRNDPDGNGSQPIPSVGQLSHRLLLSDKGGCH